MATPIHLPEDILLQIVQRLPLRSVLLWKRVSKQWKDLINDRTAFFRSLDALYCVFINDIGDKADQRFHGRNINIPPFTVHRITIPMYNFQQRCTFGVPKFLGSSYGMACFKEEDGPFLVYNLCTGSLYTVANVPKNHCFGGEDRYRLRYYGFGYDRYGDDYKILVNCNDDYNPREVVLIYSFRNKDWNSFQGFPYETFPWHDQDRVAYSMNGVLHWSLFIVEDIMKMVIVTYDLHTNRFGEIQEPPKSAAELDGIGDYWGMTVAELNGQLCYVRQMRDRNSLVRRANVWVMKEYGVGDSWERFWTIECDLDYSRRMAPTNLLYKCGGGTRLVLFVCEYDSEQRLIWYNIDENKVQVDLVSNEIWKETVIGEEQQKGK